MRLRWLVLLPRTLVVTGLAIFLSSASVPAAEQQLLGQEVENLRYILDHTSNLIPHRLNLADPKQYAYVADTLRRFGRTPQKAPHLYALLEQARKGTPGPPIALAGGNVPATLGGINYTTEFGQASGVYRTNAFSTYPSTQIPYNTQELVSLIDRSTMKVLNSGSQNVYQQTNIQQPVTANAPSDQSDVISNSLFLIAPKNGDPLIPYNVVIEGKLGIANPCQKSPNYSTSDTQQCGTSSATSCVNNLPMPKQIKVCYGPRIQNDCDYGCQGTGYPSNIIFPITGSVDLGAVPPTPLTGSLYIVLQDIAGGGCILKSTSNETGSLTGLITMAGSVASWSFGPATFPNQTCLQPNGMAFNYTFQLYVQLASSYAGVTFTSDQNQSGLPNVVIVPAMNIVEGCFPDGVRIRMADGSEKNVETFQGYGDEKVRSKAGVTRAVTATTWGSEARPLVYIRDSRGHSLLLTEFHPVITKRGVVLAVQLKKEDVVETESGDATLVEVGRKKNPAAVPIHNLRVGSEAEAAKNESTFYANGILVGDQIMQRKIHLESVILRKPTKEEILKSLPAEWHQDYLNSLK